MPSRREPVAASGAAYRNHILRRLPQSELRLLERHFDRVRLDARAPIYDAGAQLDYVYFPEGGMASMVVTMSDGRGVEAAAIGLQGIVGVAAFMGTVIAFPMVVWQVAGEAVRIPRVRIVEVLPRCPQLALEGARFAHQLFIAAAQTAACGQLHHVNERLARWLLTVKDLTEQPEFGLTQEFMAEMLGANRPTVTIAARTLSSAGLIKYTRGRITLLDLSGLEDAACECYRTLRSYADPAE